MGSILRVGKKRGIGWEVQRLEYRLLRIINICIMDKGEELAKEKQKIRKCYITKVKRTESLKHKNGQSGQIPLWGKDYGKSVP